MSIGARPCLVHKASKTVLLKVRRLSTLEDGETKTVQQLESGVCTTRLQDSILLSIAQGEQKGDLVGVNGMFALHNGSRNCTRSGGWKMKAVEQGSERKHTMVKKATSHKEWPRKDRSLRKTLQASISTSSWTPFTSLKHACRGLNWFLWLCLVRKRDAVYLPYHSHLPPEERDCTQNWTLF